jgi:wyosine [tRNA(Phe)-imidazoG37] synthetase (radical SAM superfamily)
MSVISNQFKDHSRIFENNKYVYPVISRRSEGLSLGINLSMRKECNFNCPYCQVDRVEIEPKEKFIDLDLLKKELNDLINLSLSKEIYFNPRFENTSEEYRRLNDISISGDGESTTSKYFVETAELVLDLVNEYKTKGIIIKPIVITNGTKLNITEIREILFKMHELDGGAWIKLDAGTEEEFNKVAETKISYNTILENILLYAKIKPAILQSIIYINELGVESFQKENYTNRINKLQIDGGKFKFIQLYTLARDSRISSLKPLSINRLLELKSFIETETGVEVKTYP